MPARREQVGGPRSIWVRRLTTLSRRHAPFSRRPNPDCHQRAATHDEQLRRGDHSLHHSYLFAFLPAQVAVIAQDEKGAEVRAAHERAAGKVEGNEAERSAHERVADGATAADERANRWPDVCRADPMRCVCALHGSEDFDRFRQLSFVDPDLSSR